MRLDRFITLTLVRPLCSGSARLPILMYHSVSEDPEAGVAPYFRTAVSPPRFGEHLELLQERGWRALGLREGLRAAAARPGRIAILTFDDGFRDFLTEAVPHLRRFGFTATMFLPTDYVSEAGPPRQFRGRDCLSWAEVRALQEQGIEIGCHTRSHPQLWSLPWPEIEAEITQSKRLIEERLGAPVTSFSYPFAFPQSDPAFCAGLRRRLREAGYQACVTTEIGRAAPDDDRYRLPRLPVNEADDVDLFAAKLDGAYDWLAVPQRAGKALRQALTGAAVKAG